MRLPSPGAVGPASRLRRRYADAPAVALLTGLGAGDRVAPSGALPDAVLHWYAENSAYILRILCGYKLCPEAYVSACR